MAARDVQVALSYLRQVVASRNAQLINNSATALLEAITTHCNMEDRRLQDSLIRLLRSCDKCIMNRGDVNADELMIAVAETSSAVQNCPPKTQSSTSSEVSSIRSVSPEAPQTSAADMENSDLDQILKKLNIREVPKFSPQFPDLQGDTDDDGVTTEEKKEERAEKHGQKMCEEEVQKMPDGTEVRMKKTRTMNVSQSSKHVTISTKGGGGPLITRVFRDGGRSMHEDEDEENSDFFSRDPFGRFRRPQSSLQDMNSSSLVSSTSPGESTKTKTLERTSEVSQSVSQKKEKNGKLLAEHAASKLDTSELKAKVTDKYEGEKFVDRKGEGSYEEVSTIQRGDPDSDGKIVSKQPRKHVVEYMQTFGNNKPTTEMDYFRGSTFSSYIQLNDNLRFHEDQFRRKVQFEFSSAGGQSTAVPDFSSLTEFLQGSDFGAIKLPSKWCKEEEETDNSQKAIDWQERKQITFSPDTICVLDARDYLVMRAKEDLNRPNEVRGGPRDALIVYATQPGSSLLYQEAFLVTYRTFISSIDLINKLVQRYLFMSTCSDKASQSAARHTFSVIVRVVDDLNAVELQQSLIQSSTSFVYRLIRDGNFTFARILRKRLLTRVEDRLERSSAPLSIRSTATTRRTNIFDFRSADIAAQLTFIDAKLFQAIEPAELLWWAQEQDAAKSPNLVAFTENFNNVSFWVRSLVIMQHAHKDREKYMNKFIKIMKHLRQLSNFNSYLAVLSALVSSPLARLDWNSNITSQLTEHQEIMDTSGSYKNYRQLLAKASPPCVPYIGVVLQDLTFVNVGNPSKIPADKCQGRKDMLNFIKRWHQYAILESIRKMKRWHYDVKKDEKVIAFFDGFRNYLDEETTWQRSHEIKPTRRKT